MPDAKGQDFWVAFMPNLGSGDSTEFSTLRFYIVSEYPTTATIEYGYDKTSVAPVEIPKSNVPVEVYLNDLFGNDVELRDVKDAGELSRESLHITSPDEITLCGIDIRYFSSLSNRFRTIRQTDRTNHRRSGEDGMVARRRATAPTPQGTAD